MCPMLGKDDIKEAMYHTFKITHDSHGKEANEAAIIILLKQLAEHARSGQPILLESNFKPFYDQAEFAAVVARYGIETLQVMLTASGDELLRRDAGRRADGHHDAGHTALEPESINQAMSIVGFFELPDTVKVTLNTETCTEQQYAELVRNVCEFVAGETDGQAA